MGSFRRFLLAFFATGALALGGVAAVNYVIDINGIYNSDTARQRGFIGAYARALMDSRDGLVMVPFERAVKMELARLTQAQCAVLGSSVAMTVIPDTVPAPAGRCRSAVNLAVSGAGLEDLILFAGQVVQRPSIAVVMLVVSPWQLRYGADQRWREFTAEYREARHVFGLPGGVAENAMPKLANLVNARYLARNLESLADGGRAVDMVVVMPGDANVRPDQAITRPNGRHVYSRQFRTAPPPSEASLADGSYAVANPAVDAGAVADLRRVVDGLKMHGKTVVLVLPPYHPSVWDCRNATVCKALIEVESAVRTIARDRGVVLIGGYDPRPFDLSARDFHDAMHMVAESWVRVLPPLPR